MAPVTPLLLLPFPHIKKNRKTHAKGAKWSSFGRMRGKKVPENSGLSFGGSYSESTEWAVIHKSIQQASSINDGGRVHAGLGKKADLGQDEGVRTPHRRAHISSRTVGRRRGKAQSFEPHIHAGLPPYAVSGPKKSVWKKMRTETYLVVEKKLWQKIRIYGPQFD